MPKKPESPDQPIHFEQSLTELNDLVKKMESGELPLEQSLATFEQGIKLIRQCQQALSKAEQKVEILTKQNGIDTLTAFNPDES